MRRPAAASKEICVLSPISGDEYIIRFLGQSQSTIRKRLEAYQGTPMAISHRRLDQQGFHRCELSLAVPMIGLLVISSVPHLAGVVQ